jgi:hypothetical protein
MRPEQIEEWRFALKEIHKDSDNRSEEELAEIDALCDLALKGLQVEARNSPKCEDCGFRMARGDSDRSGQEWWCPVCAQAGIRLAENKRLRAEAAAMREAIRKKDTVLRELLNWMERLEQALNERKET